MNTINVLDHGFIRLVDSMGSDLSIVRVARVSYDAEWRAGLDAGSDRRLINYLWKNKHTTPFESVEFQFDVKAPIFVFRQWHRHRTWSINELSARYRELPEEFYLPSDKVICKQSTDNKQGRGEQFDPAMCEMIRATMRTTNENAFLKYKDLLRLGVAKELARSVLPVSTYSHMFGKIDLLNLFKFISGRSDPNAQYEIRVYADAMLELVRPIVPVAVAAFEAGTAPKNNMPAF